MDIEDWGKKILQEYGGSFILGTVLGIGVAGVVEILLAVAGVGLIVIGGIVALMLFTVGAKEAAIVLAGILLSILFILGVGVAYGGMKLTSLLSPTPDSTRDGGTPDAQSSQTQGGEYDHPEEPNPRIAQLKEKYSKGELTEWEFETALEDELSEGYEKANRITERE